MLDVYPNYSPQPMCQNLGNVRGVGSMDANTIVLSLMQELGGYLSPKEARVGDVLPHWRVLKM